MCGIFGFISDHWHQDFPAALASLERRGPDASGQWIERNTHLGHRRLSILDLSEAGAQPMLSSNERYAISYNGEIYNHLDIRDELQADPLFRHQFRGSSDTETLIEAYAHWGLEKLLPRLDGMFAFAIWDREEKQLQLARDRFGIKPLFYSTVHGFIFSSTLKPFWYLQQFPRKLNPQALRDYLGAQMIPAPYTLLRDVRQLQPAHSMTWKEGETWVHGECYWDYPAPAQAQDILTMEDFVDQLDEAFSTSIQRQLISDVPVGAFLSGGIDSSLLCHYANKHSKGPLKTFNISFPWDPKADESPYARRLSEYLGTEHHELAADQMGADFLKRAISYMDQPMPDPAFLPTFMISELTRQHVTVALSGEGGDELFGGYPRYLQSATSYPDSASKAMMRSLLNIGLFPKSRLKKTLAGNDRVFFERFRLGPYPGTRKDLEPWVQSDLYAKMEVSDLMHGWKAEAMRWGEQISEDALIRADAWSYLSENLLIKGDRASMAHSLEARVPILGNPIVDLAAPQPASLKLSEGLKSPLKRLAARHIPPEIWDRPKHGFTVPLLTFFNEAWTQLCQSWVDRSGELAPFLNAKTIQQHWTLTQQNRFSTRTMYAVLILLAWLEDHPFDES